MTDNIHYLTDNICLLLNLSEEEETLEAKFARLEKLSIGRINQHLDQHVDQKLVKIDQHVDKSKRSAIQDVREERAESLRALKDFRFEASLGQQGEALDAPKFVNKNRTQAREEQEDEGER